MTWFRVDDSLHDHSKVRKVAVKAPAALALWLIAGSWSMRKLTDGFIPDDDLPWLIPGAEQLAAELVAARLWRRVRGGHQFHDWLEYQPSAEKVRADRAAAAERMRRLREGRSGEPKKRSRARSRERTTEPPANFDHSRSSLQNFSGARPECPRHPGNPEANCGPCRSERIGGP